MQPSTMNSHIYDYHNNQLSKTTGKIRQLQVAMEITHQNPNGGKDKKTSDGVTTKQPNGGKKKT